MQKNSSRSRFRWSHWLPALILLLVAAAAAFFLLHHSSFHKGKATTIYKPNVPTAGQNTKGEPASSGTENPPGPSGDTGSDNKGTGTSSALIAPSGNFVNTHHPTLTSSPGGNQMSSVCNTTPNVTCQIIFTNTSSGAVTALDSQSTDSSGAAYWSWTLQQVGLTQGTYQVKATATANGQSKTSVDAVNLVVQQ